MLVVFHSMLQLLKTITLTQIQQHSPSRNTASCNQVPNVPHGCIITQDIISLQTQRRPMLLQNLYVLHSNVMQLEQE